MDPGMEELTSSSASTGLNTPRQESPPNEGVWETGRITADSILTAGVDSSKKGNISSPMESVDTRASQKSTRTATVAGISSTAATPPKRRHKTSSEENKQFDPGGRGDVWVLGRDLKLTRKHLAVAPCRRLTQFLFH